MGKDSIQIQGHEDSRLCCFVLLWQFHVFRTTWLSVLLVFPPRACCWWELWKCPFHIHNAPMVPLTHLEQDPQSWPWSTRPHRVWLLATSLLPLPHTASWLLSSHSGQRFFACAKFTPSLAPLSIQSTLSQLSTRLSFTLKYLLNFHLFTVPFPNCSISPTLRSLFLFLKALITNSICLMIWFIACLSTLESKLHKGRELFCLVHCYVPII